MPTDTFPELAKKKAELKAALKRLDKQVEETLADCQWIKAGLERLRARIEVELRRGVEASGFASYLEDIKAFGLEIIAMYAEDAEVAEIAEKFDFWEPLANALTAVKKEAEELVAWVDELLALVHRPRPPIDEEMLRARARQADQTGSWIGFEDV